MKTIQVATDFSDAADVASQTAVHLARKLDAELLYTHAVFMDEARPNAYEVAKGHVEAFRRLLQEDFVHRRKALEAMADEATASGVRARHALLDGVPIKALCQAAEDEHADLLIMGSHGRTGFRRILLGSVAERMVRHSPTSVLVARPPAVSDQGYGHVLVCTDFGECAERAFAMALELSAEDATVDLLYCWYLDGIIDGSIEPSPATAVYADTVKALIRDAEHRGRQWIDQVGERGARKLTFHIREGRPTSAVQTFIQERRPAYDLVAVGTHGRKGFERALLGSVAEVTVRYSPCSVLIVR